jgi:hypothetical protein
LPESVFFLQAGATACLKALRFASEQGMTAFEMETDCLNLKNAIPFSDWDTTPEGMLIRELRFFIFSSYNNIILLHMSRSCNTVAHRLAHEGVVLDSVSRVVWLPVSANEIVASDLTLSVG